MSVPIGSKLPMNLISFSLFLPICVLSSSIYLNYGSLVIFTVAIFLNSRWLPDTMSVVIGTKFHIKLYITKYMYANFRAFDISIF